MSWSSLFALLIIAMHAHDEVCARCLHDKCLQTRHGSVCTHCETGYVPLRAGAPPRMCLSVLSNQKGRYMFSVCLWI